MISREILRFIKEHFEKGYSGKEIKEHLVKHGYLESAAEKAVILVKNELQKNFNKEIAGVSLIVILFVFISSTVFLLKEDVREPFTEIYFTNPKDIPKVMSVNKTYNILFSIMSHEKEAKDCEYRIESAIGAFSGNTTLAPKQTKTINLKLKPKSERVDEDRFKIILENKEIFFWYKVEG